MGREEHMIDELALALLNCDNLLLRSLAQDAMTKYPDISNWPQPSSADPALRAAAAAIAELLAARYDQPAPLWTESVAPLREPMFVIKAAKTMRRLRTLCETESPPPLKKRGFYAPPDFLT